MFRDVSQRREADEKLHAALAEVDRLRERLELENAYLQEEIRIETKEFHEVEDWVVVPFRMSARGRTTGIEGWGDYVVSRDWRLSAGFVVMDDDFELRPGRVNLDVNPMGNNPSHTAMLRSLWNVTRAHELDVLVRYSSALPAPAVPAYTVVNVRFGWHLSPQATLSLRVENAFDRKYAEFGTASQRAILERTLYLGLAYTL